jgi:hypothetical protein
VEFTLAEQIDAGFERIVAALQDPRYYEALGVRGGSGLQAPELLSSKHQDGVLELSVRYSFAGELSGPAAAMVDKNKLTWVIHTRLDLAAKHASLEVTPDHYADLLSCEAEASFTEHEGSTTESLTGSLKVHVPLFGSNVEQAIFRGLEAQLAAEAATLGSFCRTER